MTAMAIREAMVLVLEFHLFFNVDVYGLRLLECLRDLCALRCTHRRRVDLELRTDLFVARGARDYYASSRRDVEGTSRLMMSYLRAVIREYAHPVMMMPRPVREFREREIEVAQELAWARYRIGNARDAGRLVDLDDETDIVVDDESSMAEDTDESMAASDLTDPTIEPIDSDGIESLGDVSDVSLVNHAGSDDAGSDQNEGRIYDTADSG